jgi:hypothetical protein
MFKIQIGDQDPWHLSARPLALLIAGLLAFCIGAGTVTLGFGGWWWAVVIGGAALFARGMAEAIREKREMDAAIAQAEQEAGI